MNRTAVLLLASLALSAASGCRTNFGAGCEKSVDLTQPWTKLSLPIDEDDARVCASSPDELKLRSYSWSDPTSAQPAFEKALTAAGYTVERCAGQVCYYAGSGQTVSVHTMAFKVKKKNLVTVVMNSRPKSGAKR